LDPRRSDRHGNGLDESGVCRFCTALGTSGKMEYQ
jgi:hypothetical protein